MLRQQPAHQGWGHKMGIPVQDGVNLKGLPGLPGMTSLPALVRGGKEGEEEVKDGRDVRGKKAKLKWVDALNSWVPDDKVRDYVLTSFFYLFSLCYNYDSCHHTDFLRWPLS